MRKRVAYLGIKGLPAQAGSDRVVEAIVLGLDHDRYQPIVYCSRRAITDRAYFPEAELIALPTLLGKHLHATSLFLVAALHALLFGDYDLVHLHNVEASFVLPILRLRYKVISTSHGAAQTRDKWGKVAKTLIRLTEYPFALLSNICTSVSLPLAVYYQQRFKREVHHIPNGVASETNADLEVATKILLQHEVNPGRFVLFAAGRVIPTKGCHLLLQAFRQLDTDLQLIVVGDTSQLPVYGQYLQELADERVRFIPFISAKETLFGLISAARLFIFPSTVEAMSMMLLEVATLGTPIICSDIPENQSVLPEQALFFKSGNIDDLHLNLDWALGHHEQMQSLAVQAQRWVFQDYRWENIVPQYQSLYEKVLTGLETEASLISAMTE